MTATDPPASLDSRVRALSDCVELRELCDRYLYRLDQGRFDESEADQTFTDDVVLAFPPGTHRGLAGLNAFTEKFMGHWARTHHHTGNYLIDLHGDRADLACSLIAAHVRVDSPSPPASGRHFHLGGRFQGTAVRTAHGWRLRSLALQVIWTTGVGVPAIAATMTAARAAATG